MVLGSGVLFGQLRPLHEETVTERQQDEPTEAETIHSSKRLDVDDSCINESHESQQKGCVAQHDTGGRAVTHNDVRLVFVHEFNSHSE